VVVTDGDVLALRAFLAGDNAQLGRLTEGSNRVPDDRFAALVAAAFVTAVQRRWPGEAPRASIIGVVARLRSRDREIADLIDPLDAETLIGATLTDPSAAAALSAKAKATQVPLLRQLIDEAELDDDGLDALLAEARVVVVRMTVAPSHHR